MNLPLLALLLIPCAVSAQQTWQGLVFGSTAAHVRSALSRQPPLCTGSGADDHDCVAMTMEAFPGALPGEFTVQPPLELWLPALEAPLHFNTLLYFFNLDRQLARIDLMLDTDRHKAEGQIRLGSKRSVAALNWLTSNPPRRLVLAFLEHHNPRG
jgi:hypothetical protein